MPVDPLLTAMTPAKSSGDRYEIVLARQLGQRTTALFPGLDVSAIPGDGMRIRGTFADQAALHGVLARVRDLGIPLLEVRRLGAETSLDEA